MTLNERGDNMWLYNYTTGVLTRDQITNFVRINWVNLGKDLELLRYRVYDWSNGTPILFKEDLVQLDPKEGKISDIEIASSIYGDSLDIKLYEVRLSIIHQCNTVVNIFGISDTGIISAANTVLYNELVYRNGNNK